MPTWRGPAPSAEVGAPSRESSTWLQVGLSLELAVEYQTDWLASQRRGEAVRARSCEGRTCQALVGRRGRTRPHRRRANTALQPSTASAGYPFTPKCTKVHRQHLPHLGKQTTSDSTTGLHLHPSGPSSGWARGATRVVTKRYQATKRTHHVNS